MDVINYQSQLNNSEDNHWLILAKKKLDDLNKNYPENNIVDKLKE